MEKFTTILKSYSLRGGKNLNETDQSLINTLKQFDFSKYINTNPILEIGSGDGKVIIKIAQQNPTQQFISCEVFPSGVVKIIKSIQQNQLGNISVYKEDARIVLSKISEKSLSQIWILYPDPWPKKRHNKRRIINQYLLDLIYQKLNTNGKLIFATDHHSYYEYFLEIIKENEQKFNIEQIYSFNVATNSITTQSGNLLIEDDRNYQLINTIFSSKYAGKNLAETEIHYAIILQK
jgi:tRNA (guanine-N7-)-methyltransferase